MWFKNVFEIVLSHALLFLGKATISNDGATILKLLDVVHPAAKTLVDIARSQDAEVSLLLTFLKQLCRHVVLGVCL